MSRRPHLAVALVACVAACQGRPRALGPVVAEGGGGAGRPSTPAGTGLAEVAEVDLTAGAPEASEPALLAVPKSSFWQLLEALRKVETDARARAVLVRFGATRLGWARAEEVGGILGKLRAARKTVVCHADEYTNTTAWTAARGCDRVWVSPAGGVETVGVAAQVVYMNRLLTKKIGVDVDILQVGKYKGAEEPLTRDGPSPEARESLESTLAEIRKRWLAGFEPRGPAVRAAAEDGPFAAEEAARRGLADRVGYAEEAREEAKALASASRVEVRFGPASRPGGEVDLGDLVRVLVGGGGAGGRPHVAVVRAVGPIAMRRQGALGSAGITERGLSRTLRRLEEDDAVRAVVLRIDSPGGSALASDLIWQRLMAIRKKKPLVASIGDMAASGGYYLASASSRIVAEPTSIVGSIGVVGGKIALARALEDVGVHVETFVPEGGDRARAARAAYASALSPWDEATRERVREAMAAIYDLFVRRVAEGRGVPPERIREAAEGRIFAGDDALGRGLVDEWGGLVRAIEVARGLAKLPDATPAHAVEDGGGLRDLLDLDDAEAPGDSSARASRAWIGAAGAEVEGLWAIGAPILQGERAVAAMPFSLTIR